jgi:hypothetical protein
MLVIPPVPPVLITITPPDGPAGTIFKLELTGAKPSEIVTFEFTSPNGKFTGPPHTASGDGTVNATYQSRFGDAGGAYDVVAKGNQGSRAQASFTVATPATGATTTPP